MATTVDGGSRRRGVDSKSWLVFQGGVPSAGRSRLYGGSKAVRAVGVCYGGLYSVRRRRAMKTLSFVREAVFFRQNMLEEVVVVTKKKYSSNSSRRSRAQMAGDAQSATAV